MLETLRIRNLALIDDVELEITFPRVAGYRVELPPDNPSAIVLRIRLWSLLPIWLGRHRQKIVGS